MDMPTYEHGWEKYVMLSRLVSQEYTTQKGRWPTFCCQHQQQRGRKQARKKNERGEGHFKHMDRQFCWEDNQVIIKDGRQRPFRHCNKQRTDNRYLTADLVWPVTEQSGYIITKNSYIQDNTHRSIDCENAGDLSGEGQRDIEEHVEHLDNRLSLNNKHNTQRKMTYQSQVCIYRK